LAAFNAKYRDVRFILPFFIQMLLFLTPVIYPVSLIPERLQWLIYLNPMAGVITLARASFLGTTVVDWNSIGLSALVAIGLFIIGLTYFRKTERFFADVL
jgi:lipopolysaccharide transport system permease protein